MGPAGSVRRGCHLQAESRRESGRSLWVLRGFRAAPTRLPLGALKVAPAIFSIEQVAHGILSMEQDGWDLGTVAPAGA